MAVLDTDIDAPQDAVLVAQDVHVTYKVYDRRASLHALLPGGQKEARPRREVRAVRGVDVTLMRNQALGLIGRNGSGKSTLLRTLAGLVPATSGVVFARSTPVLLGIKAVLQPDLSCRRNIVLGGTALGLTRSRAVDLVDEVLDFAGISESADAPFRTLSSGMRARLQFGIATAVQPDILLIDEALAVGDAEFRAKSERRMADLLAGSGSVVLVSHSMSFMRKNCSRLMWLDEGRVLADGDPDDVVRQYLSAAGQVEQTVDR